MKSNEVGTTLQHPETINGNVKNLSNILLYLSFSSFYFKNLILPLISRAGKMEGVGTSLNRISCTLKHLTAATCMRKHEPGSFTEQDMCLIFKTRVSCEHDTF
jgi:hypothetical protein